MIRLLEPIKEDIIKWTLFITGASFVLTVITLIFTIDSTSDSINFLEFFVRKMSDYGFLLGCIVIAIGLIFFFFKRPSNKLSDASNNDKFVPKYRTKDSSSKNTNITHIKSSPSVMFSPRELKLISSGILTIGIAIAIWLGYLIAFSFLL
jgi:hypothetical protein